jgi:hypothetical protein
MSTSGFDRLGDREFERLCQSVLVHTYGAAIEVRRGPGDRGADAVATRSLNFPDPSRLERGPFVFQVKFVENATQLGGRAVTRLRQNLITERATIERRIDAGVWTVPRHYVLMTNVRVQPSARDRVVGAVSQVLPGAEVHVLDRLWLDTALATAPDLRRSFPTMLSFRDLVAVVDGVVSHPLRNRSQAFLNAARDLQPVFVATRAYDRALAMLRTHGFVVLTGPPEMGKTAIAKMLALVRASESWDVIDCRGPEDFERAFAGHRRQLCIADDVFGSTEYQPAVAQAWERALPQVIPRLDDDHWFIWTSRPAPLREGLDTLHLQGPAERFPAPANVTVDAADLSSEERALILFAHCRHATLSEPARHFVVRHGVAVSEHARFTPQRAARFAAQATELVVPATEDADADAIIDAAMADVTPAMRTAFRRMGDEQHTLLVSLLDVEAEMGVDAIEAAYDRHRHTDGTGGHSVLELLSLLEEQVLRRMDPEDRYAWAHPSWRDLVILRLMVDSAKRRRFLTRCGVAGLELAASTAGGTGDRRRPFLRTPADRELFADRVVEQAGIDRLAGHSRLLLAVSGLLQDPIEPIDGVAELAGQLLDRVRERWDAAGCVIPPDVLELYYDVSAAITPLRPGPLLDPTYKAHCARMAARFSRAAIAEYDDAIAFIQTVGRNEPRALRAWDHPRRWERGLRRLIAETERRAQVGERLLAQRQRTTSWERRARELNVELLRWRQMLCRMGRHAPRLDEDTTWRVEQLRRVEHELESWLIELHSGRSSRETYDEYLIHGARRDDDPHDDGLSAIFSPLARRETA